MCEGELSQRFPITQCGWVDNDYTYYEENQNLQVLGDYHGWISGGISHKTLENKSCLKLFMIMPV